MVDLMSVNHGTLSALQILVLALCGSKVFIYGVIDLEL